MIWNNKEKTGCLKSLFPRTWESQHNGRDPHLRGNEEHLISVIRKVSDRQTTTQIFNGSSNKEKSLHGLNRITFGENDNQ